MVDGQFLQLRYLADPTVSEEQYISVILRKTARLISSTCEIGALFGQGTTELIAALAEYGRRIGIAFQIVDDLLDYLGDEAATGKKVGNDFIEGKLTLPLIHALAEAPKKMRIDLSRAIRGDRRKPEAYSMVKEQMKESGSFEFSRQRASLEVRQGIAALTCFDHEQHGESLAILDGLAQYILRRDR
jgi:octaprenyl-diphosphate synthase